MASRSYCLTLFLALTLLVQSACAAASNSVMSVLTFTDDPADLSAAAASIAGIVRTGLRKLAVERVDGAFVLESPLGAALREAGFTATPQGLRLRV